MDVLEEAIKFAVEKHSGQVRKMAGTPYILHPLEVASIISTITKDKDVMAAGVLHDTIEDCGVDPREIRSKFGPRVSALVLSETEDRFSTASPEATWMERKRDSLIALEHTKDVSVKILWLADKLSNMRSFAREHRRVGDALWQNLHQKDPQIQRWYYDNIAKNLTELADTDAYREYTKLVGEVFGE